MRVTKIAAIAVWAAVGCGAPAPADLSRLHSDCSTESCPSGQECLSYSGIAGPSGPQLKTCEIKCTTDAQCSAGLRCTTVADGPGSICDDA